MRGLSSTARQPQALPLLVFIKMWECFSYYGMRVLLILYMVQELGYADHSAFAIYAVYTCLVELGGICGGILADRWVGLRNAIILGGWGIAAGHLCLAWASITPFFYLGLGFIVVGTSLFGSNITALLGTFYHDDDPRRDAGYTFFYMGINIGSLLATIACGFVAQQWGWHYGFGLAALGMVCGNILFLAGKERLGKSSQNLVRPFPWMTVIGVLPAAIFCGWIIAQAESSLSILPIILLIGVLYIIRQVVSSTIADKGPIWSLFGMVLLLAMFFSIEEQLGSSLVLFADRHVDTTILGYTIPPASLTGMNPLIIIVSGSFMGTFLQKRRMTPYFKMSLGFGGITAAFATIWLACQWVGSNGAVSVGYVFLSYALIAIAELFIGPTVYSYCSAVSPEKCRGVLMSLVSLGFAGANILSGYLSQTMAIGELDASASLDTYQDGYAMIASFALALTIATFIVSQKRTVVRS